MINLYGVLIYIMVYMIVYDIYDNITNSFNAFFFPFFVVFLSIQQKTVDNPLIPVFIFCSCY